MLSEACPKLFFQDQVACMGTEPASLAARGGNITLENGGPTYLRQISIGTATAGRVTMSQGHLSPALGAVV